MSSDLRSTDELKRTVESGQRITAEDISSIGHTERELTGDGPTKGGPLVTAYDLAMRQREFDAKFNELAERPQSHYTQEDAQEMQELEGRAFNQRPGAGSVAAQVRSIADRNEALGLPPTSAATPAYVTKWDASEAQHEESKIYGGQNPRGGMAAQMQVCGPHVRTFVLLQMLTSTITECSR
ncbi:hypothetical protein BJX99DRAFT_199855 [Aspergillus californicus]